MLVGGVYGRPVQHEPVTLLRHSGHTNLSAQDSQLPCVMQTALAMAGPRMGAAGLHSLVNSALLAHTPLQACLRGRTV